MGFVHQHISVEERLQIGLIAAVGRGSYGVVTELARLLGTSRKFIYTLASKVMLAAEGALGEGRPGPKRPERTIEVDRVRLDRAIVTLAMAGRVSERAIGECLAEIIETRPSLGYVSGVISRASKIAKQFNEELKLSLPEAQVEADELFSCGQAHLAAVDHASLLILALEQSEQCDGDRWAEILGGIIGRGVGIRRLGSDGGKGIVRALSYLADIEHQLDRFHALRAVGRVVRSLEQAAYRAIAREESLARKASRMRVTHPVGAFVHERVAELRGEADRLIDRYEAMKVLASWVAEALEAIEVRTGRFRDQAECLAELRAATELMRELSVDGVKKLADYLDGAASRLLAYVEQLALPMAELTKELGEEAVRLLSRQWLLAQGSARRGKGPDGRRILQARLLSLLHLGRDYPEAEERVRRVLEGVMRGSSLAECLNSLLRPYAFLMRGLGKSFLPLFQLYRNAHVFKRGKRRGHCPFQLAGIETPEGDWLDWLGLNRRKAPPLSLAQAIPNLRPMPIAA
jgi:hypothetical protein